MEHYNEVAAQQTTPRLGERLGEEELAAVTGGAMKADPTEEPFPAPPGF